MPFICCSRKQLAHRFDSISKRDISPLTYIYVKCIKKIFRIKITTPFSLSLASHLPNTIFIKVTSVRRNSEILWLLRDLSCREINTPIIRRNKRNTFSRHFRDDPVARRRYYWAPAVLLAISLKALYTGHMEIVRRSDPGKRDHPPTTASCIFQITLVRQPRELTFGTVVFQLPRNLHHMIAFCVRKSLSDGCLRERNVRKSKGAVRK